MTPDDAPDEESLLTRAGKAFLATITSLVVAFVVLELASTRGKKTT